MHVVPKEGREGTVWKFQKSTITLFDKKIRESNKFTKEVTQPKLFLRWKWISCFSTLWGIRNLSHCSFSLHYSLNVFLNPYLQWTDFVPEQFAKCPNFSKNCCTFKFWPKVLFFSAPKLYNSLKQSRFYFKRFFSFACIEREFAFLGLQLKDWLCGNFVKATFLRKK